MPSFSELERSVSLLVLPQLSLTITNAVMLTALISKDYFGERAEHVTPARLAISSGLANLLLTRFAALPMCHGAGGLVAHYRFGARSGTAPFILGTILLILVVLPGQLGIELLAFIPVAGLGALLLMTSTELASNKRQFDCAPSCWPVIGLTAGVTAWSDPFYGLIVGLLAEAFRYTLIRSIQRQADE